MWRGKKWALTNSTWHRRIHDPTSRESSAAPSLPCREHHLTCDVHTDGTRRGMIGHTGMPPLDGGRPVEVRRLRHRRRPCRLRQAWAGYSIFQWLSTRCSVHLTDWSSFRSLDRCWRSRTYSCLRLRHSCLVAMHELIRCRLDAASLRAHYPAEWRCRPRLERLLRFAHGAADTALMESRNERIQGRETQGATARASRSR